MSPPHDAFRHTNLLRQALDNPKRPIAFFLGAGCPLSIKVSGKPLIPDIQGMTKEVINKLEHSVLKKHFAIIKEHLGKDGAREPNIEDYLSHVRNLREVAGKASLGDLGRDTLLKLDMEICSIIVELSQAKLPNKTTPYHHLASWARGTPRAIPIELFTTNYDLLLEQALEECRVPYFDGFIGSRLAFFDPYAIESEESKLPPRWSRLWKMHGSINWWSHSEEKPTEVIRTTNETAGFCRLIHPSHLKYDESRQMPYLAMMDRLKAFLGKSRPVLVLCGYSFRDKHINSLITQALAGNPNAVAFGLLYGTLSQYSIATDLARITPNLCLMAEDGAIIGTRSAEWERKTPSTISLLPTGITLDPSKKEEVTAQIKVTLGNFAKFGELLQDLLGSTALEPPLALTPEEHEDAS